MSKSNIGWTNETWNPVTGCRAVSPGCAACYAATITRRFDHTPKFHGLTNDKHFTGEIRLHESLLDAPLKWKKARMVFVNSMSDLFHEDVTRDFIDAVWSTMAEARHHRFQVLTKRADRMMEFMRDRARKGWKADWSNIWLGVSVEDQQRANERIPALIHTPAAVRFLSVEPLLERVRLCPGCPGCSSKRDCPWMDEIHWAIVGGESGPNRREMKIEWLEDIVEQCDRAGVPVFVKQDSGPRPGMQGRIPDRLWARKEFPTPVAADHLPGVGEKVDR